MITQQTVSEKLLAYLDNHLSLNQIIAWAEQVIADGNYTPDSNIHLLPQIVMSLEGVDRPHPLPTPNLAVPPQAVRSDAA